MLKALELFCGIGGFAKAAQDFALHITKAYDQNDAAIATYNANFSHKAIKFNLERLTPEHLDALDVDFLWMSPPCQPYTTKGRKKDLQDPRATTFKIIIDSLFTCKASPNHIGLENVVGFQDSQARKLFLKTLRDLDYFINETVLCPSQMGIPNRRERYYLCASKKPLKPLHVKLEKKELVDFIDHEADISFIPNTVLEKFVDGFRIIDYKDHEAYTTCFTSSYGKSWMHSGAYLAWGDKVRLFTPQEISEIMGFGKDFVFPTSLSLRQKYKLIGNSLSVDVLKAVLTQFDL